ncbi:hypothetical protein Forpi1262_v015794 [Fusarium oxysporum f. sp. raphani]|uniref:Uncharacterized protein n=1 Tax=Fusarium oxysporum f. sp. raphani TaxID=96318 RepID=A0A8J5U5S8_FUSOX|nr:hypothetical protein Forpi1262_v015794 [Fusarium oxysporum f. sp. raphani]
MASEPATDPPDKGGEPTSGANHTADACLTLSHNIMIVAGGSSVAPPGTIVRVGGVSNQRVTKKKNNKKKTKKDNKKLEQKVEKMNIG